jgi:hypothetical protein
MPQSFTTVRTDQSAVTGVSPYFGPQPLFRDALDAARSLYNKEPQAHYPDGYIDTTVTSRQADKVAGALWRNQKAYSRGVHKGERIDMSDYLWPTEFNLFSALKNQATTGMRYVSPAYAETPVMLTNDGKPGPRDTVLGETRAVPTIPDPARAAQLKRITPTWR